MTAQVVDSFKSSHRKKKETEEGGKKKETNQQHCWQSDITALEVKERNK